MSDVTHVHNLADFSVERIEAMCKEFLLVRFRHVIVDILLAADVTKHYAVSSEYVARESACRAASSGVERVSANRANGKSHRHARPVDAPPAPPPS